MYRISLYAFLCLLILGCQRSNNSERILQTEQFTHSPQNNYLTFESGAVCMVVYHNRELYVAKEKL